MQKWFEQGGLLLECEVLVPAPPRAGTLPSPTGLPRMNRLRNLLAHPTDTPAIWAVCSRVIPKRNGSTTARA